MSLSFRSRDSLTFGEPRHRSPLELLADLTSVGASSPTLYPEDFIVLCVVDRPGLPRLHLYKHLYTRRLIALDDELHAWRYSPGGGGEYVPVASLADAVDALELGVGEKLKALAERDDDKPGRRRFLELYDDDEGE